MNKVLTHLLLHRPPYRSLKLKSSTLLLPSSLSININNAARRRRPPGIGSLKITSSSFKKAAVSLRHLFSQAKDPFNLLLLLLHYGGGGGGGGLGFPTGGSDGEWFGKRNRGEIKRLLLPLLFSIALASAILGVGKKEDWELGIRVLMPMVVGFKVRYCRHWIGLLMILGPALYLLLRRKRENRKQW